MVISNYPLLSVMGLEIELMLVHKETLMVAPQSDQILKQLAGTIVNEHSLGTIAVSNELVLHVLEIKNNGPQPFNAPFIDDFQQSVLTLNAVLESLGLQFLPSGAHPFMNPLTETNRWMHGNKSIYETYDKIFNCQGHGFSNLQSMHINLPFQTDEDFHKLHAGLRVLLPLLPAIAASTPFLEGRYTGLHCARLHFYNTNQQRIPIISGDVIPEPIQTQKGYEARILNPIYEAIKPYDPEGFLQFEWLNSRAAIPKFNHGALEIRIIDAQECITAHIAIAKLVWLILEDYIKNQDLSRKEYDTPSLRSIYDAAIVDSFNAVVDDKNYLSLWGLPETTISLKTLWDKLITRVAPQLDKTTQNALDHILTHGNLSQRLLTACTKTPTRTKLETVYRSLGDCLLQNTLFMP